MQHFHFEAPFQCFPCQVSVRLNGSKMTTMTIKTTYVLGVVQAERRPLPVARTLSQFAGVRTFSWTAEVRKTTNGSVLTAGPQWLGLFVSLFTSYQSSFCYKWLKNLIGQSSRNWLILDFVTALEKCGTTIAVNLERGAADFVRLTLWKFALHLGLIDVLPDQQNRKHWLRKNSKSFCSYL